MKVICVGRMRKRMSEEVKCIFCGDDVVRTLVVKEDNSINGGYTGALHNGHHYPLCWNCNKLWCELIGCLLDKFIVEGKESLKKVLTA